MVQLAWLIYDDEGEMLASQSHIIRPEGFKIPKSAERIHGISTDRALEEGVSLKKVMAKFSHISERQKIIVGHNLPFDKGTILAESQRLKMPISLPQTEICTMRSRPVVNYCRLPCNGGRRYKWPKLSELHYTLFKEEFEAAHDALKDATVCAKCFFKLKEMGVIG